MPIMTYSLPTSVSYCWMTAEKQCIFQILRGKMVMRMGSRVILVTIAQVVGLIVDPALDHDEVLDEAGELALEEGVVAHNNVLHFDVN